MIIKTKTNISGAYKDTTFSIGNTKDKDNKQNNDNYRIENIIYELLLFIKQVIRIKYIEIINEQKKNINYKKIEILTILNTNIQNYIKEKTGEKLIMNYKEWKFFYLLNYFNVTKTAEKIIELCRKNRLAYFDEISWRQYKNLHISNILKENDEESEQFFFESGIIKKEDVHQVMNLEIYNILKNKLDETLDICRIICINKENEIKEIVKKIDKICFENNIKIEKQRIDE